MSNRMATDAGLAAYRQLMAIKMVCDLRSVGYVAARIRMAGIVGERDSTDNSPVGLWLCQELRDAGVPVGSCRWIGTHFDVYDEQGAHLAAFVIGDGPLYDLECRINDLAEEFADLVAGGEADPR
ncbi:hypothetical protein [Streptomonospora litoralis]|uniref:Uncharacterized protein n=1 Tax=Streptomonospora litoralis TaxID=2498135 RepID=A0A4P6Q7I3_9ACTN|nr:hypothetical protein [Streptomonospora litoralis]QBI56758.1 hypothetical protein EKD16_25085 [Streptomonospora litoralis]